MQLILLITKQAFTMRNVWESVVSEAWRGSPFILTGHTMQPDRILNRILIGYFFLEGKCQILILFNQNHFKRGVRYCFEIKFPARKKAIRSTVAELHKFFSTYGNILLKKSQDYTEKKIQTWVPFRQKCHDKTF